MKPDLTLPRHTNPFDQPIEGHYIDDDGDEVYKIKGDLYHRTDGPAMISPNGSVHWFINDIWMLFEEWCQHPDCEWSDDQIVEWKLQHEI